MVALRGVSFSRAATPIAAEEEIGFRQAQRFHHHLCRAPRVAMHQGTSVLTSSKRQTCGRILMGRGPRLPLSGFRNALELRK